MNHCPDDTELQGLLSDRLPADLRASLEGHIEACPTCQRQLDALTQADLNLPTPDFSGDRGPTFLERVGAEYPATLLNGTTPATGTLTFPGPPTDDAPLGQLGDFDIVAELGSGSFGWVFRARERSLDRIVALKVLKPEMTVRPDAIVRFEREARKASLKHDHIVSVFRFEKPAGFPPYIVMEFVEGETLEARLKRDGKVVPEKAAAIARQVALGLAAAHEHGMVHRDIKPANILLEKTTGRAKISDFGLARDIANESLAVTGAGELAGTAPYMSPEHFRSPDKVDGRSDVFSLGVVLYQMLTGQLPFKGSFLQIRSGILEQEPKSPRRLNDSVPVDLETITLACLEKDAERRYATAEAVAEDLRRYQMGEPILCRPTGRVERAVKWVQRKPAQATLAGVATIAVLAFVALGIGLFFNAQLQAVNKNLTKAKSDLEGVNGELRIKEAHVKRLNYVADMNLAHQAWQNDDFPLLEQYLAAHEKSDLRGFEWHYLRWLANTDGRRIGPKEPVIAVAFDSIGGRLALGVSVGDDVQIQIWAAPSNDKPAGMLLHTVGRQKSIADIAFHPKGDLLITSDKEGSIRVWDVTKNQTARSFAGAGPIAVSPDGRWLAYVLPSGMVQRWSFADQRDIGAPMRLDISRDGDGSDKGKGRDTKPGPRQIDADKPGPRTKGSKAGEVMPRVLDAKFQDAGIQQLAFSKDGTRLAIAGGFYRTVGRVAVWDLTTGAQLALHEPKQNDMLTTVAFSPDGKSIAAAGYDHILRIWDLTTGAMRVRRAGHKLEVLGLAFNFTGDLLASAGWDKTVKLWNPRTGEELRTLRGNRAVVRQVVFSPAPDESGQDNLVSLNAADELRWWDAGHEQSARVTELGEPVHALAFSAKGRYLAALGRGAKALIQDFVDPGKRFELALAAPGSRGLFSQDENTLFTAGSDGTLQGWPFALGGKAVDVPRMATLVNGRIVLGMDDHWLVSPAHPPADSPLSNMLAFGPIPKTPFAPMTLDAAGIRLAIADKVGVTVRQRDKDTGALADTVLPIAAGVNALAFSPDGRYLAVDNPDFSISLWDVDKAQQVHRLTGHLCVVGCLAFSPDGKRLGSGSEDWTVKLWDIDIGRTTLTLAGHKGRIRDVAFSPDGKLLASASEDGTVRVWPSAK